MQTNTIPLHIPAYISMDMLWHIVSFKIIFTRSCVCVCLLHPWLISTPPWVRSPCLSKETSPARSVWSPLLCCDPLALIWNLPVSQWQFSHWDFHLKFGPEDAQSYVLLFPWQQITWSQITELKMPLVGCSLERSTRINKQRWSSGEICKPFSRNLKRFFAGINFHI